MVSEAMRNLRCQAITSPMFSARTVRTVYLHERWKDDHLAVQQKLQTAESALSASVRRRGLRVVALLIGQGSSCIHGGHLYPLPQSHPKGQPKRPKGLPPPH